jgi:hypothetical protein
MWDSWVDVVKMAGEAANMKAGAVAEESQGAEGRAGKATGVHPSQTELFLSANGM